MCVAFAGESHSWIIVMTPKTDAGKTQAGTVADSIMFEHGAMPQWTKRNLGASHLTAELPFELDPLAKTDDLELRFSDYVVHLSATSGTETKAAADFVEAEQKRAGTTDYTSKDDPIESDRFKGRLQMAAYTRDGKKYTSVSAFVPDGDKVLRLTMIGLTGRRDHEGFTQRILSSLKVSTVDFRAFLPRVIGTEGLILDLPKELEDSVVIGTVRAYNLVTDDFRLDVRSQSFPDGAIPVVDSYIALEESVLTPRTKVTDLKSETTRRLIGAIDARILKLSYLEPDQKARTYREALILFIPGRTVVVETKAAEGKQDYLDRVTDTVQIQLPAPENWVRWTVGDAGLSVMTMKRPTTAKVDDSTETGAVALFNTTLEFPKTAVEVWEYKFLALAPEPPVFAHRRLSEIEKAIGANATVTDERPFEVGDRTGVLLSVVYESDAGKVNGYVVALRRQERMWLINIAYGSGFPGSDYALTFLNSLR